MSPPACPPNPNGRSVLRGTLFRQLLNDGERLLGIGVARYSPDRRNDLAVTPDDEGGALGHAVTDLVAAGVLQLGDGLSLAGGFRDFDIVGLRYFALLIRGHRQLAGAILRIGGEVVQAGDAVERNADDAGAGGGEFVVIFRKGMCL